MLELHIANKNYSSWSLRPWFIMKALNIPFIEKVHFFEEPGTPSDFPMVSPTAKLPVLVDDGLKVWDTISIIEYLAELYPVVWPEKKKNRAWARSACAEMHSGFLALRKTCSMNVGVRVQLHEIGDALRADIDRMEKLWEDGFVRFNGPWLAGESFSAADAFFGPVAFRFRTYGIPLNQRSQAYVNKLLGHPAMMQWESEALQESKRDRSHDIEIEKFGVVVKDFRVTAAV